MQRIELLYRMCQCLRCDFCRSTTGGLQIVLPTGFSRQACWDKLQLSSPSLQSHLWNLQKSSRHVTSRNQGTFSREEERGSWERGCSRPRAQFFPRPANNVFIFFSLENYFIRIIFVDFLLQQCACV